MFSQPKHYRLGLKFYASEGIQKKLRLCLEMGKQAASKGLVAQVFQASAPHPGQLAMGLSSQGWWESARL